MKLKSLGHQQKMDHNFSATFQQLLSSCFVGSFCQQLGCLRVGFVELAKRREVHRITRKNRLEERTQRVDRHQQKDPHLFLTQKSSFLTQKSSFLTQKSSSLTQKSSFLTQKSSFLTHKSSSLTHKSSFFPIKVVIFQQTFIGCSIETDDLSESAQCTSAAWTFEPQCFLNNAER